MLGPPPPAQVVTPLMGPSMPPRPPELLPFA